ncbi:hypothetical protein [Citrobacter freundii]|uniref:hypothetical protein n=1 Tax=Citrobacter freundii TaxID=546 RepID=UPI000EF1F900|nr:hypothetical protein [Citrobacter freundii]AYL52839.1 hypothetical protein CUC47_15520 [Citrobacter freundii]
MKTDAHLPTFDINRPSPAVFLFPYACSPSERLSASLSGPTLSPLAAHDETQRLTTTQARTTSPKK